jgi:UDP-N-acetylmuramoyl-tripeptide--D-alanyl-D-alanine ligase
MAKIVPDVLVPGDVVLVKGSRGGGEIPRMQMVVEALRKIPTKFKTSVNTSTAERL